MKSDLDRLMQERGFDGIVVMGEAEGNHALHYMTNGSKITSGIVLKKPGEEPVLIVGGMERDEAAKSGLMVRTMADFNFYEMVQETGSVFEANVRLLARIFEEYGVRGRVSFYGVGDPGQSFVMLSRLAEIKADVYPTGETETTIFDEAYATKDDLELEAIRSVAERTNAVMDETVGFVRGHTVEDGRLVKQDGTVLTVGDVKTFLRTRLLAYDLFDDGSTIFAIGRDAGVPHSRGEDADPLELGKSIVFDLFPRDLNTGYYHDMTRTFCLGHAPDDVRRAYDEVMHIFNAAIEALEVGTTGNIYQEMTCDFFEERGHPTIRTAPGTEQGYVHSLGHGLGLQIHSRPRLSAVSTDVIKPRQVLTIEPGLYYPDEGYGVRVEDTVFIDDSGEVHSLTPFPKDLVIEVG